MTKQEYMKELTEKLSVFDEALAKEILDDYEGHFREGSDNGKTEEVICEELGKIDEIIEELRQLYEPKQKDDNNFQSTMNDMVSDALNLANNVADTIVKGIKSGIDYGKKTWYEKTKEDVVDAECTREKVYNCTKAVIDAGCADVTVIAAEDDELQIEYINHGSLKDKILYHFHGEQRGETFYGRLIREQGNSSLFQMLKSPEIEITVKLPKEFEVLEISTTSGDINTKDMRVKEARFSTASGDLTADNSDISRNVMESASGDVTITNTKGNSLKIRSKSGDATMNCCIYEEAVCKSKSGDLNGEDNSILRLTGELSSGSVQLEALKVDSVTISDKSGDICLSGCKAKELTATSDSGEISIKKTEAERMEANSESGDIEIMSKTKSYAVKSISGDIVLQAEEEMTGTIKSTSGSVDIKLLDGENGYTAEISTVSGDVTMQFENGSKHGMHKGIYTMGNGKSALTVSNVSGDIRIQADKKPVKDENISE